MPWMHKDGEDADVLPFPVPPPPSNPEPPCTCNGNPGNIAHCPRHSS